MGDLLVFVGAVQRAFHRQAADFQHPVEPIRVAAVGQAGDVVEALGVQRMAVPDRYRGAVAFRVLPFHTPVIGDVHQLGVEIVAVLFLLQQEKAHETELVGGVLLAAKHRQLQFADQQVPHLMHQGELGVGHGEAHRFHRQLGRGAAVLRRGQHRQQP